MPGIPALVPKEPHSFLAEKDVDEHSSSDPMAISRSLQPSMAYLAVASSVSVRAAYPHSHRKLLILDLNGTLLLRPKPRNAKRRPIHPRPYISSFCSYIFHETVKPWLETMVWSSAQPHSVNDMVARCFKDRRDELKTVWARDMLGLDKNDYCMYLSHLLASTHIMSFLFYKFRPIYQVRKVQTVKDLERCWSGLPDSLPSHSAETTLLIDDSARKAHLQPHNHLCVSEYTQNMRNRDLIVKRNIVQTQEERKSQVAEQVQSIFLKTIRRTLHIC